MWLWIFLVGQFMVDEDSVVLFTKDGVDLAPSVRVRREGPGKYRYRYVLHNLSSSTQRLFRVVFFLHGYNPAQDTFPLVDSIYARPGWTVSCCHPEPHRSFSRTPSRRYFWFHASMQDPVGDRVYKILDSLDFANCMYDCPPGEPGDTTWETVYATPPAYIMPGDSDTFVVVSSLPPDLVDLFWQGLLLTSDEYFPVLPVGYVEEEDPEDSLWRARYAHVESLMAAYDAYVLTHPQSKYGSGRDTVFVGPGRPVPDWPSAYSHLMDRIHKVDSVGWFLDSTLRTELESLLTEAYEAYKRQHYLMAYQKLSIAMNRLNAGRGTRINDWGFYVLYFRLLEAREKLPGNPGAIKSRER